MQDDVLRADWGPDMKAHRLNLRVPPDLYALLRDEARESGLTLSALMRLALREGVGEVAAQRIACEAGIAGSPCSWCGLDGRP